ncbi:uncharacterized protein RSE6_02822 [Rhynchosporium secalis]|uniref:Uncharacterized protein n=1 Tax=Rhynchosporium secalis TaxID=38038 RepID=A0A1E1M171_RHYSE|nr:uncharacterized protein RSE6_02822 [Rhynchosporium secalis]
MSFALSWNGLDTCRYVPDAATAERSHHSMYTIASITATIPTTTFNYRYDKTSADSLLRKYAFQVCAARRKKGFYREFPGCFPQQMLIDIAETMVSMFEDLNAQEITTVSDFHVKSNTE